MSLANCVPGDLLRALKHMLPSLVFYFAHRIWIQFEWGHFFPFRSLWANALAAAVFSILLLERLDKTREAADAAFGLVAFLGMS